MSLSSPRDVNRDLLQARELLYDLAREYRWLYGVATSPSNVGERAHVSNTDPHDPTGSVVVSKDKARKEAKRVHELIRDAIGNLRAARDAAARQLDRHDPPQPMFEQLRHPRTASRAELSSAAEAARRRAERGEGIA